MNKKTIISALLVLLLTSISTLVLAAGENMAQDAVNTVRGAVQGVEEGVEDTAKDVSNASKEGTQKLEQAGNSIVNDNSNNGDYDATRTSTGSSDEATLMGMTATTWTWVIMALAALAIIALVWYYTAQQNNKQNYNSDE